MSKITQKILIEYQEHQKQVKAIMSALYEKAREVWIWENEHLGKNHKYTNYCLKDDADCIEFYDSTYGHTIKFNEDYILNNENLVTFIVYDSWAYGGYDEKELSIPLYKLLSDDWKMTELKKYQEEQNQKKKEQLIREEALTKEKEEKERAEYERLKAKFEKFKQVDNEKDFDQLDAVKERIMNL